MGSMDRWDENDLSRLADAVAERVIQKMRDQAAMVSRDEYARKWSIGVRTVDRAIAQGRLRVQRVGRRVLIPADADIRTPCEVGQ